MANVQSAQDVAHVRSAGKASTTRNWRWQDPPILFPMFIIMLISAYAGLRASW